MRIVIINGSGGCGKDSVVKFVKSSNKFYVYNFSTVDPVKLATDALNIPREPKDETIRKFTSDLKDMWTKYYDGPFEYIKSCLQLARISKRNADKVCFVHSREPKELTRFKDMWPDCIVLLVRRPGYAIKSNHADKNVENFNYDYIIENDSDMNGLQERTNAFIKEKLI